jgi:integrase/recombinase XerD
VNQQFNNLSAREKAVARLWRSGGISSGSIKTYLDWVRRFHTYSEKHGLNETTELTLIGANRFVCAYMGPRTKGVISASTAHIAKNALHAWAFALNALGIAVLEWRPERASVPIPRLLKEYCEFRRHHRGVSERTIEIDIHVLLKFFALLRARGKHVNRITISDLDAFVRQLAAKNSHRTVARSCTSLRTFLRFLRSTGRVRRDLASCVLAPRVRKMERPPRALPWADVKRIIASVKPVKSPGKRDLTILLMLALYGMGAGEVLTLRLEDVDWQSGIISVRRPKTGVRIELPLLPPVARALAAYLKDERSPCARTRHLFVNTMIPYQPLTRSGIYNRIRVYARKAGVSAEVLGAHAFRHAHASRQVDGGANLKVVSDILGHRRPSSTSVYVRGALRRPREVALPVPK